ncbi:MULTISPECIES: DUF2510 domain-containing protein [unclassified Leucobacter]|uniref:DUF2510 domain-containing protein n=1 Tax=unclassified Leucobacter TaxID=2621730 RepID=UPI0006222353|nr:DUF2510 domain-containing protein [Leucobacter sp. Ag1]KKI19016.1 hypothetical protein XM48_10345 [Leucobacter sp. Ag1]
MPDAATQNPPAGWYPNANNQAQWWDGTSWGQLAQPSDTRAPESNASAADSATEASPTQAPPGWYPTEIGLLRYWDGSAWTQHHAPLPTHPKQPSARTPRRRSQPTFNAHSPASRQTATTRHTPTNSNKPIRLRWKNLLSLRWWWFTFGGALFLSFLIGMLSPVIGAGAFPFLLVLVGFVWLTLPMTCDHCGKMLKSSKIGDVTVCHHCHQPVD